MAVLLVIRDSSGSLRCGAWRQASSRRSQILGTAETENREEYHPQKRQTDPETDAFTETFGQIDAENYADNKIHEWNEHQNDPPGGPADNFAPNVKIIDRDDAGPAGLAGFGVNFPAGRDHQDHNRQPANPEHWPGRLSLSGGRV